MAGIRLYELAFLTLLCSLHGDCKQCVSGGEWNPSQCFEMLPVGNVMVEVGQDIITNCSVKIEEREALSTVTNLPFTIHNLSITPVPANSLKVFEEDMTLQVHIANASAQTELFQCYYQKGQDQSLVSAKQVKVRKIPEIGPINCVSYNLEKLTCFFRLETEPVSEVATLNWKMYFTYNLLPKNSTVDCVSVTRDDQFNMKCKSNLMYPLHPFQVKARGFWNSTSEEQPVYTSQTSQYTADYSIVQSAPLTKLEVVSMTSTNVTLTWTIPFILFMKPIATYEVHRQSLWENSTYTFNGSERQESMTLRHLVPNTQYNVRIRLRLPQTEDIELYWSNWTTQSFKTLQDVPFQPVTIAGFMYEMDNCKSDKLCLVIYWRNPEPQWSSGELTKYKVTLNTTTAPSPQDHQLFDREINGRRNMLSLYNWLPGNQTYKLQMRVATKVGYSELSKSVPIPDHKTGVQVQASWVLVEVDAKQRLIHVTWKAKPGHCKDIVTATHYRCIVPMVEENYTSSGCKEDIDWVQESVQDGCTPGNYTWSWTENQSAARYAVSLTTTDGLNGGLVWEGHRYNSVNMTPDKPVYTAKQALTSPRDVNITIIYPSRHTSDGGRPDKYNVTYKGIGNSQSPKCPHDVEARLFTVNFSNPELMLKDLTAGSRYVVCVTSQNSAGFSDPGDPAVVKLEALLTSGEIVGITIGSTIALVIIVSVCCYVYRTFKRMRKHIFVDTEAFDKHAEKNNVLFQNQVGGNKYVSLGESPQADGDLTDSGTGPSLHTEEEILGGMLQQRLSISSYGSNPLPGYERLPLDHGSSPDHYVDCDSVIPQQHSCNNSETGNPVTEDGEVAKIHVYDNPIFSTASTDITEKPDNEVSPDNQGEETNELPPVAVTEPAEQSDSVKAANCEAVENCNADPTLSQIGDNHHHVNKSPAITNKSPNSPDLAHISVNVMDVATDADDATDRDDDVYKVSEDDAIDPVTSNEHLHGYDPISESVGTGGINLFENDSSNGEVLDGYRHPNDIRMDLDNEESDALPGYKSTVELNSSEPVTECKSVSSSNSVMSNSDSDFQELSDESQCLEGYETTVPIEVPEASASNGSSLPSSAGSDISDSVLQSNGPVDNTDSSSGSYVINTNTRDVIQMKDFNKKTQSSSGATDSESYAKAIHNGNLASI